MKNGQSAALSLSESQKQVIISGILGDGCIAINKNNSIFYITNCKYLEYIEYKRHLLGDLYSSIRFVEENGFCKTPIWTLLSKSDNRFRAFKKMPIPELLNNINELGIALWFYDDGSLHQKHLSYNLNTHSFSREIQERYFLPFFNKLGIFPKLQIERKKDGRVFWYLRIGKFSGADKVNEILLKYPISCYSYKRWSSETIQKWSKFQEKLKSTDIDFRSLNSQAQAAIFKRLSI